MKKTKNEKRDAQKKRTSHKAVESVLRPEGSLWWERFLKKVGLEPGVKERGSLSQIQLMMCSKGKNRVQNSEKRTDIFRSYKREETATLK